jgi:hypothetical protein
MRRRRFEGAASRAAGVVSMAALFTSGCAIGLADHEGSRGSGRVASSSQACVATRVETVQGVVVDTSGTPIADAKAQLCAQVVGVGLVCLPPADTDASGRFAKDVGEDDRCMERLAIRVLLPSSSYGTTYCPVDLEGASPVFEVDEPMILVPLEAPRSLPPLGDESTTRPVTLAGDLVMEVRPSSLWGEYDELRAAEVDARFATCFLEANDDVLGLYAFAPEGTTGGGFEVSFPERTGLPDGSAVELMVLGGLGATLSDGTFVDEGELAVFGRGTVVGGQVRSDPGSEVPYLSWLAYREAR